jgi:hypothetical protein
MVVVVFFVVVFFVHRLVVVVAAASCTHHVGVASWWRGIVVARYRGGRGVVVWPWCRIMVVVL